MFTKVILASVAFMAVVSPQGAFAQFSETAPVASAPAPRLVFSAEEMALAHAIARNPGLAAFYGENGLHPVFSGKEGALRRAALMAAVAKAPEHGLPIARYDAGVLARLDHEAPYAPATELAFATIFARWTHDIAGGAVEPRKVDPTIKREVIRRPIQDLLRDFARSEDPAAVLAGLEPSDPRYIALQNALAQNGDLIAPEDVAEVASGLWKIGVSGPAVGDLRVRLASIGFDAGPPLQAETVFDENLARAVAAFQARAGLPADGVAGPQTIARLNRKPGGGDKGVLIALERMRWMNGLDMNARMVWVNLPEFNARIIEGGHEEFQTRTVIGSATTDRMTPEFSDQMEYVVVNPRWNVPRSITVKEYLPKLQANRNAVSHLDVVDGQGRVVSRDRIDFNRYSASSFPYRLRQKPSDRNALGLVKFLFPNPWNIYLHDTPTKHLFSESARAYSHGCIRIGKPFDLAEHLLQGQGGDPHARFQSALDSGKETWLPVRPNLPVHLVYFTTFPDENGVIHRYRDVYGRDDRVYDALIRAGLESSGIGE